MAWSHWEGLGRFLADGALPIDNNHIENQMRPWALGRRNWLFIGSQLAGERAAVVMSLLQSAKLNGHEPWAYLKDVLTRMPTLCLRLGLIDKELFGAINAFRDIRNVYAHQLEYSGLSTEPYASKIAEIYRLISWYEPFVKMAATAFDATNVGSMQFKAIAALVVLRLKQAVDELVTLSTAKPKTLISVKWEVVRMGMRARGEDA